MRPGAGDSNRHGVGGTFHRGWSLREAPEPSRRLHLGTGGPAFPADEGQKGQARFYGADTDIKPPRPEYQTRPHRGERNCGAQHARAPYE
jgi:hypothetical protein